MKKLVVKDKTGCMACLECVRACSEAFYKEFDPDKSCIQIVTGKDGNPKPNTCIQCGKCQEACKMDIRTWKQPNSPECIRCGDCIRACPVQAIQKEPLFRGRKKEE